MIKIRQISIGEEIGYESVIAPNYFVTETGKVYSIYVIGGQGRTDIDHPHELSYGQDKDGYKRVVLSLYGKKTYTTVHRLIAEQFIGQIEEPLVVNHKDGNIHNNHKDNLEIVTVKENTIHAHLNGLTSTECPVRVECNGEEMLFRSMVDCCNTLPDISRHYLEQLKKGTILFSMIDFKKLERSKVSKIASYYNGRLYKEFANMKTASLFFGKSKGTVSAAINNPGYRRRINKYHITFPSVSTIENIV